MKRCGFVGRTSRTCFRGRSHGPSGSQAVPQKNTRFTVNVLRVKSRNFVNPLGRTRIQGIRRLFRPFTISHRRPGESKDDESVIFVPRNRRHRPVNVRFATHAFQVIYSVPQVNLT